MPALLYHADLAHPAATNMAIDDALLESAREPGAIRLRTYRWEGTCFTFGRMQPYRDVRERIAFFVGPEETTQLIRRPTGGGVVDHRTDWTYALVIPRAHPLCREKALDSYRAVHVALAKALGVLGVAADLAPDLGQPPPKGVLAECFATPSPYDVIDAATGRKIAGAAQRRSQNGLLFQGSLEKQVLPENLRAPIASDLGPSFARELAKTLSASLEIADSTLIREENLTSRIDLFASDAWNHRR